MRELWIPELIIFLFYLLFLLQSPVWKLRTLAGLVWLPPIGLILNAGIFPAYGFRPECIPLLAYGIVLNMFNLPALAAGFRRHHDAGLFIRGMGFTLVNIILLAAVTILALRFSPLRDTAMTAGVKTVKIRDEGRDREYFLRIYGADGTGPFLLVAPPPAGSVLLVDKLCGELERRGFTVMTYSRRNFDAPAVDERGRLYLPSPGEFYRRLRAFNAGTRLKGANETGRALEEGRKEDLEFLLSRLRENSGLPGRFSGQDLFLAGYGAGGSALVLLAGSPGFAGRNPEVRGIIALESVLWSSWRVEEKKEPPLPSKPGWTGRLQRRWAGIKRWFAALEPKKMARPGPVYPPELPLLLILSGRALDPGFREGPYSAILGLFDRSREPGLLVAAKGAGPLDYTDCPEQYPLIPALFPGGGKERWNGENCIEGTAAIISGFAALVLEARPGSGGASLSRETIPLRGLHTERRAWNLPDPPYILVP